LRTQGELARSVMTYLRTSKHAEIRHGSSQVTRLHPASSDTGAIISAALQSLQAVYDPDFGYKKAGVVLLDLHGADVRQLAFTDEPTNIDRKNDLMQTIDALNAKFHTRLVRHASEHPENEKWRSKRELRSQAYTTNWAELRSVK
jgi:DNA polymerase V